MNIEELRSKVYQQCVETFPGVDCYKAVGYHLVQKDKEIDWWMWLIAGFVVGKIL